MNYIEIGEKDEKNRKILSSGPDSSAADIIDHIYTLLVGNKCRIYSWRFYKAKIAGLYIDYNETNQKNNKDSVHVDS